MLVGVGGHRAVVGIAGGFLAADVVVPVRADSVPGVAAVGGLEHLLQLQIDVLAVAGVGQDVLVVVGLDPGIVATGRIAQGRIGIVELVDVGDEPPRTLGAAAGRHERPLSPQVAAGGVSDHGIQPPTGRGQRRPTDGGRVDVAGRSDPDEAATASRPHIEPVVLDGRRIGVALPTDHSQDAAATGARERDHIRDLRARRIVDRSRRLQHWLPSSGSAGQRRAAVQAMAGGRVDVATDPHDPVHAAAVQLSAANPPPCGGAAGQPVDANAVLVLPGIVGLTRSSPDRAIPGISSQSADRESRESLTDRSASGPRRRSCAIHRRWPRRRTRSGPTPPARSCDRSHSATPHRSSHLAPAGRSRTACP